MIAPLKSTFGTDARNRIDETVDPTVVGAVAALESFYHAFNHENAELIGSVWADDPHVRLYNPVGGIVKGGKEATDRYRSLFAARRNAKVTFHDIIGYHVESMSLFAGREDLTVEIDGTRTVVPVRTSRIFIYINGKWRQVHHHGSVDDPETLDWYQEVMTGVGGSEWNEK
jgi:hypothetical protein